MKKYMSISLSILLLLAVVLGMFLWMGAFDRAIRDYRSPIKDMVLPPQPPTSAHTDKVVMVVISGLGYDNALALNLPAFEQLQQTGASAAILSIPPTYSQTAWGTLITGAAADSNDAPPFDLPTEDLYPLAIDTLFTQAQLAQRQIAIFGQADWQRLIPADQVDASFFMADRGPQADELILETALPAIKDKTTALVVLQFTQMDFAAEYQGGLSSPTYLEAADQVNAYLNEISTSIDLSRSVLIVLADHGHIASGGHGGDEVDVVWQPFVMVGENIIPGNYSDIFQTDIAPTISSLLGLAPPPATQGRILHEMLRLNERDQASAQLTLVQQRIALAAGYQAQAGDPQSKALEQGIDDLAQAQAAFDDNNISGAFQLALLAQSEADGQISGIKNSQIRTGQLLRFPFILVVWGGWLIMMWQRRGKHLGLIVVAAMIAVFLYHGIYQLQGYDYSISSFTDISRLPLDVARRAAISLLGGGVILLLFLILVDEGNGLILLGTTYGFSVLVTFSFLLPFLWGFWQNGWGGTIFLPAVLPAFWQITGGLEAMMTAGLGLLLPWPITILTLFIHLVRRRLRQDKVPQSKPGALPGLRL